MPIQPIQATPSAYPYPLLIKQLLHTPLATQPDQEIVYGDKFRYTYRDFAKRVHRLAHGLSKLGVVAGDTVAMMDWDSHRYLESFFAVPMMGAVLQTVNVRLSADHILYTLNHAGANVLLVNHDFLEVLEQIRPDLITVKKFIFISDGPMALPAGFDSEYESLLALQADHYDFPDFDESARATTFYTAGTTGLPKGVYFSHRQLVLHTLAVTGALALAPQQGGFHRDDVYMPLTPMSHVHAWGLPYVATLAGVKQVYPGRYMPEAILRLIEKEKVTFSHCMPTLLHMMLVVPYSMQVNLSRWKVIVGGGALAPSLARMALAKGIDVFSGYGMSETCPLLTLAQVDVAAAASESPHVGIRTKSGRPVPLVDLEVVDPHRMPVSRDGVATGEVVVRAPWLTQGYLGNPDASEQLWEGGYLHTQDVGSMDPQGYLQVTDRLKDVIKSGGEWISSLKLEDLISRHPAVAEAAVIGAPDEKWGERPLALIVVKPGSNLTADGIQAHVKTFVEQGVISRLGIPERVKFVASLVRTSVGKLNKRAMREQNS